MRRVRSSKCGQTERNFRFNSDSVFTSTKHNANDSEIDTFIYLQILTCEAAAILPGNKTHCFCCLESLIEQDEKPIEEDEAAKLCENHQRGL